MPWRRRHPWPTAAHLDYTRYAAALRRASPWCYWRRLGWLPWSGMAIRFLYTRGTH